MRHILLAIVLLALLGTAALADDTLLWQQDGIDSGGGGWWYSEQLAARVQDMAGSGVPAHMMERVINEGVPGIKRATVQRKQLKYRWYWYGFRFRDSTALGIRVAGPGAMLLTFTDPGDPTNTFTTTDWGMLVSCDQMMNCFTDTANGPVTIAPLKGDRRGVLKVWCLIRLPKVINGQELDRVCELVKVQPITGKWEVIK